MKAKASRYPLPDLLRGIALINMIAYHAVTDCVLVFGMSLPWYDSGAVHIWQRGIGCLFILLAGFCAPLGGRSLQRGLLLSVCGGVITLVTQLVMPQNRVLFGILTFLGAALLLWNVLHPLLERVRPSVGLVTAMLLFLVTVTVPQGALGIAEWPLIALPQSLYRNALTAFFGFRPASLYSADYYPLIPWFFLFAAGYYLFRRAEETGQLSILSRGSCPVLCGMGRHSLLIYLVHQPVLIGIMSLIF